MNVYKDKINNYPLKITPYFEVRHKLHKYSYSVRLKNNEIE